MGTTLLQDPTESLDSTIPVSVDQKTKAWEGTASQPAPQMRSKAALAAQGIMYIHFDRSTLYLAVTRT